MEQTKKETREGRKDRATRTKSAKPRVDNLDTASQRDAPCARAGSSDHPQSANLGDPLLPHRKRASPTPPQYDPAPLVLSLCCLWAVGPVCAWAAVLGGITGLFSLIFALSLPIRDETVAKKSFAFPTVSSVCRPLLHLHSSSRQNHHHSSLCSSRLSALRLLLLSLEFDRRSFPFSPFLPA